MILFDNLCKDMAISIEQFVLKNYYSFLYNVSKVSDGGDNISYHPDNSAIRKRISDAQLRKWKEDDGTMREEFSTRVLGSKNPMSGKTHSPEARAKISRANKGRVISKEAIRKSQETKARNYTKEELSKIYSDGQKKRYQSEDERSKTSQQQKQLWSETTHREKMRKVMEKRVAENEVSIVYKNKEYKGTSYKAVSQEIGISYPTLIKRLDSKSGEWSDCWRVYPQKRYVDPESYKNRNYNNRKLSEETKKLIGKASKIPCKSVFKSGEELVFSSSLELKTYFKNEYGVSSGTISTLLRTGEEWRPKKYIHKKLEGMVIQKMA